MGLKSKLGAAYAKTCFHTKKNWDTVKRRWFLFRVWIRGIFCHRPVWAEAATLIVCAHPDDETIFFSSVMQEKPYVLCMSNRGNAVRKAEFYRALKHWDVSGEILNFPDFPGAVWIWRLFAGRRLKRLRRNMPNVCCVYTHSGSGESEHAHHFAVHNGVKKAFPDCDVYTTAVKIPNGEEGKLSEAAVAEKYQVMLQCYPSQVHILEKWCSWWTPYLHCEHFERFGSEL